MKRRLRSFAQWTLVGVWCALLASWLVSFRFPHGNYITGLRRYGLWCDAGFIQFRYGTNSEIDFTNPGRWTIHEIGYSGNTKITWGRRGPRIVLAQWPPVQQAEFASGGEVPTIDGRTEFFGERIRIWGMPHWLPLAMLSPLIGWIMLCAWRQRRARRIAAGLCVHCGYDLRASPDRCPECGTIRTESPAPASPAT